MKRKGTKVYILSSQCAVIGAWTNLKKMIDALTVENSHALYHRIYRHTQKFTEGADIPAYDFEDIEGKPYQLKIEILQ